MMHMKIEVLFEIYDRKHDAICRFSKIVPGKIESKEADIEYQSRR